MDNICWLNTLTEIAVHNPAKIGNVFSRGGYRIRVATVILFCCADQCEVAFEGNGINHSLVVVLQHVDVLVIEQTFHHDLTDPSEAGLNTGQMQDGLGCPVAPCPGRVDQHARGNDIAVATINHCELPDIRTVGARAPCAVSDGGSTLGSVASIGDDEPIFIDDAVGKFKCNTKRAL